MRIEAAGFADCAQFVEMQVAAWRLSYKDLLAPQDLGEALLSQRQEFWQQRFSDQGEDQMLAVARGDSGQIIAVLCATRAAAFNGGSYVEHLYVAPHAQGQGTGRALMAHAARWCESAYPETHLALSVIASNHQAVAFYRRLGATISQAQPWQATAELSVPCLKASWDSGMLPTQP